MSFLETPTFPDDVTFEFQGGPTFSTDIVVNAGGYESRNQNWSQARRKWTASHPPKNKADTDTLIAFFSAMVGRANGFRFKDWSDYSATASEGVFVLLTSTTFQMYKSYTTGALTHSRKITKPKSGIVVTGGTGASVDTTTGIVTVSSGTPTAWAGEFDTPARFDSDEMRMQAVSAKPPMYMWGDISITEIRL